VGQYRKDGAYFGGRDAYNFIWLHDKTNHFGDGKRLGFLKKTGVAPLSTHLMVDGLLPFA
jgi:hypothetical protein